MKFFIVAAVFLHWASISAASPLDYPQFPMSTPAPSPTGPSVSQVTDAIHGWNKDIIAVNAFLLTSAKSLQGTGLQSAAMTALSSYALDEQKQRNVLGTIPGLSTDGKKAIGNLKTFFQVGVLDQLQAIIKDADSSAARLSFNIITEIRCHQLLQDVQALWLDASKAVPGVTLPAPDVRVQRPTNCANPCQNL